MSALTDLFRRRRPETIPIMRPPQGSTLPELVLCPNLAADLSSLILQRDQWAEARSKLAALQLYERVCRELAWSNEQGPNGTDRFDAVHFMENLGPPIDFECPVIKYDPGNPDPWNVIRATAWNTRRAVDFVQARGGTVRLIAFDDPISGARDYTPALPTDDIVAMIASWMREVATRGVTRFGHCEAYPAVAPDDLLAILDGVRANGSLEFVRLDVDWSRIRRERWPLARVRDDFARIHDYAAAHGLLFDVLLVGPDAGSGEQHCTAAMELLQQIPAYLGGQWPDRLVLQSFDLINGVRDVPPILPERLETGGVHPGTHAGLVLRVAAYLTEGR